MLLCVFGGGNGIEMPEDEQQLRYDDFRLPGRTEPVVFVAANITSK